MRSKTDKGTQWDGRPTRSDLLLQVFWCDTGMFCHACQHLGSDFLPVMEGEHDIRPTISGKCSVRTRLPLNRPANTE